MKTSDRWLMAQWILIGLLGLSLLAAPRTPLLSWARIPGAILAASGLVLVGISAYTYRTVNRMIFQASPEPKPASTLVDTGIYSLVRHPVYTGVILGSFGVALFRGSFWSLLAAAVLSGFYYLKSRYEEGLLIQTFPGYEAYRRRTGRFLPLLRPRRGRNG